MADQIIGTPDKWNGPGRASATQAHYMELQGGRRKDADCEIVNVDGGVSSERGCCNFYSPDVDDPKYASGFYGDFKCGDCEYVRNIKSNRDYAAEMDDLAGRQGNPNELMAMGQALLETARKGK